MLVYVLTHPEERDVHKRFSVILVETSTPGYEATKIHGKLGIRASNTAEVSLNNLEVPVGNLSARNSAVFISSWIFSIKPGTMLQPGCGSGPGSP